MRIRTVKPEFWKSESNAKLSLQARLVFIGLFNHADDEGRFRATPALIKAELFPYDDISLTTFRGWLDELSAKARKVSKEQEAILARFRDLGCVAEVVRSYERFREILEGK